ncbi:MAG: potassium transporter TrkA, partial [Halorientalis sp.]
MASLPVELLYGLYLGVLLGVVPVLVAWSFGFLFKYVTGVTVPGLGVVVLSVAIAGASGGLLALTDPTLVTSGNQVRLTVALLVVLMASLYAHAMGDKLGATLPRRLTLKRLTERTLSADVVELAGGRGQVRVTVVGEVDDIEGYPPLPADLRETIADSEYTFPADVPLVELEGRVADRLRADHDLAEVSVRLDERARATVAAAPPVGGLSKRVPAGGRAVSVQALVPAGLAPGDEVTVSAGGGT